jgi:crossover junction endodeoxyribonuclease RusA
MAFACYVPGKPAPQGSKRHVGGGRMIESSTELGPWRERVALAAHAAMGHREVYAGPMGVTLDFVLPRPKSAPKRSTPAADKRPDIDKLVRAILDALTGVTIHDDAQVVRLYATKRVAEIGEGPGVHVCVVPVVPRDSGGTTPRLEDIA